MVGRFEALRLEAAVARHLRTQMLADMSDEIMGALVTIKHKPIKGPQAIRALREGRAPPPPKAPKWPGRVRKELEATQSVAAKAVLEDNERNGWTRKLVDILKKENLLAVVLSDPGRALMCSASGLRHRTLRQRVKDWSALSRFLRLRSGRSWPAGVEDIVEYAQARVDEPCIYSQRNNLGKGGPELHGESGQRGAQAPPI